MELEHEMLLMEQEEETAAARARGDAPPVPASEADAKALADAAVRYFVPALSHVEPRSVVVHFSISLASILSSCFEHDRESRVRSKPSQVW